eukprot:2314369-Prymnesium_polylepis.1
MQSGRLPIDLKPPAVGSRLSNRCRSITWRRVRRRREGAASSAASAAARQQRDGCRIGAGGCARRARGVSALRGGVSAPGGTCVCGREAWSSRPGTPQPPTRPGAALAPSQCRRAEAPPHRPTRATRIAAGVVAAMAAAR